MQKQKKKKQIKLDNKKQVIIKISNEDIIFNKNSEKITFLT